MIFTTFTVVNKILVLHIISKYILYIFQCLFSYTKIIHALQRNPHYICKVLYTLVAALEHLQHQLHYTPQHSHLINFWHEFKCDSSVIVIHIGCQRLSAFLSHPMRLGNGIFGMKELP